MLLSVAHLQGGIVAVAVVVMARVALQKTSRAGLARQSVIVAAYARMEGLEGGQAHAVAHGLQAAGGVRLAVIAVATQARRRGVQQVGICGGIGWVVGA